MAEKFGLENRENLLIEEMSELTQAIIKQKRKRSCERLEESQEMIVNHITEEIADVLNLLEQFMYLLNCESDVEKIKSEKIQRTIEKVMRK